MSPTIGCCGCQRVQTCFSKLCIFLTFYCFLLCKPLYQIVALIAADAATLVTMTPRVTYSCDGLLKLRFGQHNSSIDLKAINSVLAPTKDYPIATITNTRRTEKPRYTKGINRSNLTPSCDCQWHENDFGKLVVTQNTSRQCFLPSV